MKKEEIVDSKTQSINREIRVLNNFIQELIPKKDKTT